MKTPEEIKIGLEQCAITQTCKECAYYYGKSDCINHLMVDALAYIQRMEQRLVDINKKSPRWISVKEREPEPFISVLGYIPDEAPMPVVREGYRVSAGNCNAYYFPVLADRREITHWMEIPQPPKEDENVT